MAAAPRDGTGAKVTLSSTAGVQRRDVTGGNGHYNVQPSRVVTFGLGGDECAADVQIRWPSGEVQPLGDLAADQHVRVTQGGDVELVVGP